MPKLTARRHSTDGFDIMEVKNGRFAASALPAIMMNSFEHEVDALLSFIEEERNPAVSEAIIRRYATAEEIWEELQEQQRRIALKMEMLGNRVAGGWSGREVLEGAGEPDTETP